MKIVINNVFLDSENLGGSWTYSYNLAKHLPLVESGHEIIIIVNSKVADRFSNLGLKIIPVDVNTDTRFQRVFWEQVKLPRIVKDLRPDIFHTTGNILPYFTFRPSVLTIHDFQFKYYPKNFSITKRNFLKLVIPHSVRSADRLICVSKYTQEDAIRLFDVNPNRTVVVYEAGLNEDELDTATDGKKLRQKYNLPNPFILYAGSFFPHKNLDKLIKAYYSIVDQISYDMVIVGGANGESNSIVRSIAAISNEYKHRIKTTGFIRRNDLIGLYKIASIYVFPSLFEGFGIPIIEAMQCGCPVITSNITSLPEVGGDAVLYVDPHNINSIAKGMLNLYRDDALRKTYITKGYSQSQKFSWKKMAHETLSEYKKLLT